MDIIYIHPFSEMKSKFCIARQYEIIKPENAFKK